MRNDPSGRKRLTGVDEPVIARDSLLTGERTVPGVPSENYWFRRHEAAYQFLLPYVRGSTVLEIGSGEGYGTALLAGTATWAIGIDYDTGTVRHATAAYTNVPFVQGNLAALPIRSTSIDVVAALQVIEHVWNHAEFLAECLRVLRPGGQLLLTTPNRLTFSPGLDRPMNPFHTKEFSASELTELLRASGAVGTEMLGLHASQRLRTLDVAHGGSFTAAQLACPPDEWDVRLARDVAGVRTADFTVSIEDVDTALDLVAIATSRGTD